MVDRLEAVLVFAGADEDKVFDEVHAFELLQDELLLTGVQLLIF